MLKLYPRTPANTLSAALAQIGHCEAEVARVKKAYPTRKQPATVKGYRRPHPNLNDAYGRLHRARVRYIKVKWHYDRYISEGIPFPDFGVTAFRT